VITSRIESGRSRLKDQIWKNQVWKSEKKDQGWEQSSIGHGSYNACAVMNRAEDKSASIRSTEAASRKDEN
jgi:hypothetical protein